MRKQSGTQLMYPYKKCSKGIFFILLLYYNRINYNIPQKENPMNDISQIVSHNIKRLRKERQLTLQELSDKSGVSVSMLGSIERGDTTQPLRPSIKLQWIQSSVI